MGHKLMSLRINETSPDLQSVILRVLDLLQTTARHVRQQS